MRLLRIARSLAIAAHDLNLIGMNGLARVLHLERNVLDQESPDLVAEAVRIKVTLSLVRLHPLSAVSFAVTYLECQSGPHLLCQHLRDTTVKVRQDLHRQLRLDATLADQVVKGVCQSHADAEKRPSQ